MAFDIEPETADCVIDHILNDHLAPRLLAENGELVLHASAVRFGDDVALFLGETGVGKSTLAASLHQAGYQLLGDDAVIVTRTAKGYLAQSVYPSLRLYPDVIANLIGDTAQTAPMADYSDKKHVSLPALPDKVGEPLRLAAIFFLDGDVGSICPVVTTLDSTRACIKLVEQSFSLDPRDPRCVARRLAALSMLALNMPTFSLSYPHDFARLGEVHGIIETIMNDRSTNAPERRIGTLAP